MKEPLSTSTPIKEDSKKQVHVVAMSPKPSQDDDQEEIPPSPKSRVSASPLFGLKSQFSKEKITKEKYQRTDDYAQVRIKYVFDYIILYVRIVIIDNDGNFRKIYTARLIFRVIFK